MLTSRRSVSCYSKVRMSSTSSTRQTLPTRPLVLPRLPVPELRSTLDKYLASIKPFLLEDESRGGTPFDEAYALRERWADEFASGIGSVCQDRLKALDRESPNNWLEDNFWLKQAYLQWRTPLLVNSNWWLAFNDDEKHSSRSRSIEGCSEWQLTRATWLAYRLLEFKHKVDSQELYPETTRIGTSQLDTSSCPLRLTFPSLGIWFRDNISKMFNLARIPHRGCDTLSENSPSSPLTLDPAALSLTVTVNNWFYSLRVYDYDDLNGRWVMQNPKKILAGLSAIAMDADTRPAAPEIGVLSADDRDIWASNLQYLLTLSPKNRKVHDNIIHSLMCLCLDNKTHTIPPNTSLPSGTTQENLNSHLHSVRSVASNVANRFFDKTLSLIVDPSGRAGAMGEHSPFDALVPSLMAEYALEESVADDLVPEPPSSARDCWERLDWVVDDKILSAICEARTRAEAIIQTSDYSILWFEEYGVNWIKDTAKLNPDAYIQMALQLAWYRTRGEFTATYETALTRMFNKGRTETIRTFTMDSRAFVLAMVDPKTSLNTRSSLLYRAIQTHTSLTRQASTGRGIDRHLLGLRNILKNDESVALFNDPLFARSQEWKLSTSGLHAGCLFRGTGFGAAYEDGYGINYLAAPDMVKFGIESKFSSSLTSTERFQAAVVDAMRDMKAVCLLGSTSMPSRL